MSATLVRTGSQCVSVSLDELLLLAKKAKELSLSPSKVKSMQPGQHVSRLFGRGMEFAECRRYQHSDDIRSIDWRVTARTGKVHTKLFAAEKERQVLICVDMRSSMYFATKGVFKSVQGALIMGYLAWSAAQAGNRLGGMIFNDVRQDEFRPAVGQKGVLPLMQCLAEHARAGNTGSGAVSASMDLAVQSIKRLALPGSLVFVISDFRKLSSVARDMLIQISKHCDLGLCFLYDPLEAMLPKNGLYPVSDGQHKLQVNTFDKKTLDEYKKSFHARREQVASLGLHRHIRFMEFSTESDCFALLKAHYRKRKDA